MPSHQGTNRPRKGPNGESGHPTKWAPWPRHKGSARRAPPRAYRGSETTNGSIGANRGEKGPGQHPAQTRVPMHQSCKAAGAGSMSRVSDAKPNQGMRNVEGNLQVWPRPSATKGDKQRTSSAKAGRALRKTEGEPLPRAPPRACRGSETTNGSIGANQGEKGPGKHPSHS
ncbi:hypothetical protein V6N13_059552 [Hibiscus sabdariffa]